MPLFSFILSGGKGSVGCGFDDPLSRHEKKKRLVKRARRLCEFFDSITNGSH